MDVLVVEDDQSNRDLMVRRLARHGIAATSAASSREAIRAIGKTHPAIVLLDLGLPDESGVETLKSIKRGPATSGIRVIVTTSDGMARRECNDAGADAFLLKPIDAALLFAVMERFGVRAKRDTAAH